MTSWLLLAGNGKRGYSVPLPDNTAQRVIHAHDQQKLKLAGFPVDRTHYRHQRRWQTSLRKIHLPAASDGAGRLMVFQERLAMSSAGEIAGILVAMSLANSSEVAQRFVEE